MVGNGDFKTIEFFLKMGDSNHQISDEFYLKETKNKKIKKLLS